jgi:hypothetical protein
VNRKKLYFLFPNNVYVAWLFGSAGLILCKVERRDVAAFKETKKILKCEKRATLYGFFRSHHQHVYSPA